MHLKCLRFEGPYIHQHPLAHSPSTAHCLVHIIILCQCKAVIPAMQRGSSSIPFFGPTLRLQELSAIFYRLPASEKPGGISHGRSVDRPRTELRPRISYPFPWACAMWQMTFGWLIFCPLWILRVRKERLLERGRRCILSYIYIYICTQHCQHSREKGEGELEDVPPYFGMLVQLRWLTPPPGTRKAEMSRVICPGFRTGSRRFLPTGFG